MTESWTWQAVDNATTSEMMSFVLGLSFKSKVSCTYEWPSRKENDEQRSAAKDTAELCKGWNYQSLGSKCNFMRLRVTTVFCKMGKPQQKIEEKNPEVPEKDWKLPSPLLRRAPHCSSLPFQEGPTQFKLFPLVSSRHMPRWTELQMRSGKCSSLETIF